ALFAKKALRRIQRSIFRRYRMFMKQVRSIFAAGALFALAAAQALASGHQIASSYCPAEIFEEQLKKCGVEYFDFYLLHNVCENSFGVYTDPKWDILNYFKEQKRLGRIRHLGFSSHARPDTLARFLDYAGDSMEFCQIQMNYLDWSLQDAKCVEKFTCSSHKQKPTNIR
ncbi:MAG: aldo/keto reductase, partial [Oscillospiraceae bacterium]|nr:aldo/keto reductase [Oscillospiraceae bacterium]